MQVMAAGNFIADGKQYCDRAFFAFDTSALPDDATITDVKLGIYVSAVGSTSAGGSVNVYSASQASTSALATSDFGLVGSTPYATAINFSSFSAGAYNEFTLNSTGRAAVSVSGFTKLCLRTSIDTGGTGYPSGVTWSEIDIRPSEYTGTGSDPYLLITYVRGQMSKAASGGGATAKTRTANLGRAPRFVLAASDTLLDSAGTNLSAHTPSGGGSWTDDTGASADVLGIRSAGAGVLNDNSVTGNNSNGFAKHSATPASADYDVEIDFTLLAGATANFDRAWALLRWNYSTEGLSIYATTTGVGIWRNAPSGALLTGPSGGAISNGAHTLRGQVRGNYITALLDGTLAASATDTVGTTGPGKGGIRVGWASHTTEHAYVTAYRLYDVYSVSGASAGGTTAKTFERVLKTKAKVCSGGGTTSKTFPRPLSKRTHQGLGTPAIPGGVSQTGAPTVIEANSGSADGLNYNAFPGLCEMPNGQLLAVWHHANDHVGSGTNKLYCSIGTRSGGVYSWSTPTTLTTLAGAITVSAVNLCDLSCITLANGDVMVMWNESSTPGVADITTVVNWKFTKSSNGSVWHTPTSMAVPGWATTVTAGSAGGAYALAPCPPIQLVNGDLLLATYGWDNRVVSDFEQHEYVKLMRSSDMGSTWTQIGTPFPDTVLRGYDETALLEVDGTILAVARTAIDGGTQSDYWINRSTDGGVTWGTPAAISEFTGVSGGAGTSGRPSLVLASDGTIVLHYRVTYSGNLTCWPAYAVSLDHGATWTAKTDPYDGAAARSGAASGARGGLMVYGAFANITANGNVAFVWAEQPNASLVAALYFRELTVLGTPSTVRAQTRATFTRAVARAKTTTGGGATTGTVGGRKASVVSGGGTTSGTVLGISRFTSTVTGNGTTTATITTSYPVRSIVSGGGTSTFTLEGGSPLLVVTIHPQGIPEGTVLGAYRRWEWKGSELARRGAGPGAAVMTTVVDEQLTATFVGLDRGEWVAYSPTYPNRRLFFMVGQD